MQLISLSFLGFFLALLAVHWLVPRRAWQNGVLLGGNFLFLASWGMASLLILAASSIGEWLVARRLEASASPRARSAWLWTSVALNLATIAFFKYACLLQLVRPLLDPGTSLHALVPVGVSFWVLQKMTLTLDLHSGRMKSSPGLGRFLLAASFFPTLISGPIERVRNLLGQWDAERSMNPRRFAEGIWLVALGILQKSVLADNVAGVADSLLGPASPGGLSLVLGLLAYAVQIYCDFAGYSDLVRGLARLLGVDLQRNFLAPYLAQNLSDFWKRWHISLSSWLNDYIFSPTSLAARQWGTGSIVLATWCTFLASGLWHGTGWQFLVWGSIHAAGLTVFVLTKDLRKRLRKRTKDSSWPQWAATAITFAWVCLGYLFFRSRDLSSGWHQLGSLFTGSWSADSLDVSWDILLGCLGGAIGLHALVDSAPEGEFRIFSLPIGWRTAIYLLLGLLLMRYYAPSERFLYFQF